MPHAMPVRSVKKERRYVKEGSGRCHVFFVSMNGFIRIRRVGSRMCGDRRTFLGVNDY